MARAFVGSRKGLAPNPPQHTDPSATGAVDSREDDSGDSSSDPDVVTCPNCDCQFDENTQDVVKAGKKVEGEDPANQGADLDVSDSPVPGRLGTAHDAAMGDQVMGNLLANLRGGMR